MQAINVKDVLERLNKELLHMQEQEKQRKDDEFLSGKIDAYEEIIDILEGEPFK